MDNKKSFMVTDVNEGVSKENLSNILEENSELKREGITAIVAGSIAVASIFVGHPNIQNIDNLQSFISNPSLIIGPLGAMVSVKSIYGIMDIISKKIDRKFQKTELIKYNIKLDDFEQYKSKIENPYLSLDEYKDLIKFDINPKKYKEIQEKNLLIEDCIENYKNLEESKHK